MLDLCWKTEIKTKKLLFSSCSKKLSQVLTTWSVVFLTHSLEGFFPPIFFLSLEYRNCLNSSLFKFEYVNCPHSNFSSHSTTGLTHTWKDATSHRKKKKKTRKGLIKHLALCGMEKKGLKCSFGDIWLEISLLLKASSSKQHRDQRQQNCS